MRNQWIIPVSWLTQNTEILPIFDIHRIEVLFDNCVTLVAEKCSSAAIEFHNSIFECIHMSPKQYVEGC